MRIGNNIVDGVEIDLPLIGEKGVGGIRLMLGGDNVKLVVQKTDGDVEILVGAADQAAEILKFFRNLQTGCLPFVIIVIELLQFIVDVFPVLMFGQNEDGSRFGRMNGGVRETEKRFGQIRNLRFREKKQVSSLSGSLAVVEGAAQLRAGVLAGDIEDSMIFC